MTQRPTANPKLASQIQSDASWTDYERQFLMDYVRKPTPSAAADNEANKENVPNYNPQPVLRPPMKHVRTYEKPQPAPKKHKTVHPQASPLKTKPSAPPKPAPKQPQGSSAPDPKPVQPTAGPKLPPVLPPLLPPVPKQSAPPSTAPAPVTTVSAPTAVVSTAEFPKLVATESNLDRKSEEAVRRRIREIKVRVNHLEERREESLDEQWKLFLEAEALQQRKFELRAESHRVYSEIEREIFTLRKEYTELMCVDRKLLEDHE